MLPWSQLAGFINFTCKKNNKKKTFADNAFLYVQYIQLGDIK